MASQPKRQGKDLGENYSSEMKAIIDEINNYYLAEYPNTSITTEMFLLAAMSNGDTMLYKCLNMFLSTINIGEIRDKILATIKSDSISGLKPIKRANYSTEFVKVLKGANNCISTDKKKFGEVVYSDLVLINILNMVERIQELFGQYKLTLDVATHNMQKLHKDMLQDEEPTSLLEELLNSDLGNSKSNVILTGLDHIGSLFQSKPSTNSSKIADYCTNLTALAENGKIEELVGRDKEIKEIVNVFNRRKCNNAILVGSSGVGKTAIVEGLADLIIKGRSSVSLKNCTIYKLKLTELMSGTQFRGAFETRMTNLLNELSKKPNVILFLDNIDSFLDGRQQSDFDIANMLSDMLTNDNTKVIAATTDKGYKTLIARNPTLERKFQKIIVEQPSISDCIEILNGVKSYYEEYHKVKYSEEFINDCPKLCKRYITDRALPSSAIDILDEAGTSKKITVNEPDVLMEKYEKLAAYKRVKDYCIKSNNDTELQEITEKIEKVSKDIALLQSEIKDKSEKAVVTIDDLYSTLSSHTNIPLSRISKSEKQAVSNIGTALKKSIIGQDQAIDTIAQAIKRSKVGLYPKNKPIGSFLCIGNSGVGKTLLAKQLAKEIFGDEKYLVRFDMSEYVDDTSVNKLIGASAGYIGYEQGGLLTEALKKKKHCVLLFDEIEKANNKIFNLFLQIMDEGFLTDNEGTKVDFKNCIIIMTSNIGTKEASLSKSMGFNADDNEDKKDIIEKEMKNKFSPEFINRLTDIIYFNSLTDDNLKSIIKIELSKLKDKLKDIGYSVEYNNEVISYLFSKLEDSKSYGARPITNLIQNDIENKIADLILSNNDEKKEIAISVADKKLLIV